MSYDPKVHQIQLIVQRCGELLYPEERNLTKLIKDTYRRLRLPEIWFSSREIPGDVIKASAPGSPTMPEGAHSGHLPTPEESIQSGMIPDNAPRTICPECKAEIDGVDPKSGEPGKVGTYFVFSLCVNCKDAEATTDEKGIKRPKYRSKFLCSQCGHTERSERPVVSFLQEWGYQFGGMKKDMGIKTSTDEGLK